MGLNPIWLMSLWKRETWTQRQTDIQKECHVIHEGRQQNDTSTHHGQNLKAERQAVVKQENNYFGGTTTRKTAGYCLKTVSKVLKMLPDLYKENVGRRWVGPSRWAVKVRWSLSLVGCCWLRMSLLLEGLGERQGMLSLQALLPRNKLEGRT